MEYRSYFVNLYLTHEVQIESKCSLPFIKIFRELSKSELKRKGKCFKSSASELNRPQGCGKSGENTFAVSDQKIKFLKQI